MHRRLSYRLFAIAALAVAAISCGRDKIIPKDKMIELLSEMYLTDQYIRDNIQRQRMADTSYVYKPIIESFGYTEDDFRRSVDKYIQEPAEFGAMFGAVAKNLRNRKKDVDLLEKQAHKKDSLAKAISEHPIMNPDSNKVLSFLFRFLRDTTHSGGRGIVKQRVLPKDDTSEIDDVEEIVAEEFEEVIEEAVN